jgi:hypothetical protein
MKTVLFVFVFSSLLINSYEQEENESYPLTVSGYVEVYYTYDFNKPENNARPSFVYSHNRHNEVNLNLGFIKAAYNKDNVRANLALMTGTYPNANLAAEPGVLKNIYEANVGVKLSPSKDLWLDAGVFGSHIGFESAIGKDCWTLTRSILADNTPYYEAGAKVSYNSSNGKWFLSALVLNGWQRIQRVDGNSIPSFGTQITFKPSDLVTLNSSTFIGTDKPDSARQMRYFHNFYGIFQLSKSIGLTIGFDYGVEEKSNEDSGTNAWMSPVVIAKFAMSDRISIGVRGEYYDDENGVIISTGTPNGFNTTGVSANVDYQVAENTVWRFEVRNFNSKDDVFEKGDHVSHSNTAIATALAISF